eukprot:359437-Chlamydomonas_euryale.AAC.6
MTADAAGMTAGAAGVTADAAGVTAGASECKSLQQAKLRPAVRPVGNSASCLVKCPVSAVRRLSGHLTSRLGVRRTSVVHGLCLGSRLGAPERLVATREKRHLFPFRSETGMEVHLRCKMKRGAAYG